MPAKTAEAMARKRSNNAVREAKKRQRYRDSRGQSTQIDLSRQHHIKTKTDLSKADDIECTAIDQPGGIEQHQDNVTLVDRDTDQVILQRIAPSSYSKALELQTSSLLGKYYYDRYLAEKTSTYLIQKNGSHKFKLTRRKVIEHHLGIWHTQGKLDLNFTKETSNPRYKAEALDLLNWARQHTHRAMNTAKYLIDLRFRSNIASRRKGKRWLASIFGSRSVKLLHPDWTTVAFFSSFAGGIHRDTEDCIPSYLFNFGEAAWIKLPEFSAKILIEPLDLVILNSRTFYHRTKPLDDSRSKDAGDRWAFSGFFRESIFNREAVCKIAQWRLDAIFEDHKE
ncbi:uncharacterized protein UTRI_02572 [Ustilago trichophora]|uniref:Uncharacterized protein n=1 Tax=Ustilago trichophora TaxID=86804 RepID=A0A5C3E9Q6_9BASI|nr:uncharacterized protein UTRI_02572 [Ustilago trichophora]